MTTTYSIETAPKRTLFGKRTGRMAAKIVGPLHDTDAIEGDSISDAKSNLLGYLHAIEEHHGTRRYLVCGDGTILAIHWFGTGWAYDIFGGERTFKSSCMARETDLETFTAQARAHAEQSYGGVVRQY